MLNPAFGCKRRINFQAVDSVLHDLRKWQGTTLGACGNSWAVNCQDLKLIMSYITNYFESEVIYRNNGLEQYGFEGITARYERDTCWQLYLLITVNKFHFAASLQDNLHKTDSDKAKNPRQSWTIVHVGCYVEPNFIPWIMDNIIQTFSEVLTTRTGDAYASFKWFARELTAQCSQSCSIEYSIINVIIVLNGLVTCTVFVTATMYVCVLVGPLSATAQFLGPYLFSNDKGSGPFTDFYFVCRLNVSTYSADARFHVALTIDDVVVQPSSPLKTTNTSQLSVTISSDDVASAFGHKVQVYQVCSHVASRQCFVCLDRLVLTVGKQLWKAHICRNWNINCGGVTF